MRRASFTYCRSAARGSAPASAQMESHRPCRLRAGDWHSPSSIDAPARVRFRTGRFTIEFPRRAGPSRACDAAHLFLTCDLLFSKAVQAQITTLVFARRRTDGARASCKADSVYSAGRSCNHTSAKTEFPPAGKNISAGALTRDFFDPTVRAAKNLRVGLERLTGEHRAGGEAARSMAASHFFSEALLPVSDPEDAADPVAHFVRSLDLGLVIMVAEGRTQVLTPEIRPTHGNKRRLKIGSRMAIWIAEYREYLAPGNPELCFPNIGKSFSPTNVRASQDRKSSPVYLGGDGRRSL
jgi:hypothetical protein